MPRDGQPGAAASRIATNGPTTGTTSRSPVVIPIRSAVGLADREEHERGERRDDRDHQYLPADERTELLLDQLPGIAKLLAPGRGTRLAIVSIAWSRSKSQYAAAANVNRIPTSIFIAVSPAESAGWMSGLAAGRW